MRKETAKSARDFLENLRDTFNYGSDDVARLVKFGAANSLQQLLSDPAANLELCKDIATVWASQEPRKAIRFFLNQSSYRADDCLAEILPLAFSTEPDLVIKAIRSKPLTWQRQHLKKLMTGDYRVSNPHALKKTSTDDPFAENDSWISNPLGPKILEAFSDPELQKKALSYLEQKTAPSSPTELVSEEAQPETSWEEKLTSYNSLDWDSRSQLQIQWKKEGNSLLSTIVEHGNLEARNFAIRQLVEELPRDPKEWPVALRKLDEHINALGVIPPRPPRGYPTGPYLLGEVPAKWIARQSPALQRSWTPSFVEAWAQREPAKALDWSLTLPQSQHRDLAIQKGLIVWAHQTPAEARGFVEALPAGDLRESSISNAATSWSRVDPNGARQWLNTLPESPGQQRALERLK